MGRYAANAWLIAAIVLSTQPVRSQTPAKPALDGDVITSRRAAGSPARACEFKPASTNHGTAPPMSRAISDSLCRTHYWRCGPQAGAFA
jgi:hypothetical protein